MVETTNEDLPQTLPMKVGSTVMHGPMFLQSSNDIDFGLMIHFIRAGGESSISFFCKLTLKVLVTIIDAQGHF